VARGSSSAPRLTFALAAVGLLDGHRATTHWRDAAELAARHPTIKVDPDVLYIDAGPVLTSAGVAAGIGLCLHLVRLDHGAEVAARVARRMVVAPHREGGQAQFVERPLARSGTGLAATCAWALDHLTEPRTVTARPAQAMREPHDESWAADVRATGRAPRPSLAQAPILRLKQVAMGRAPRMSLAQAPILRS